MRARRNWIIAGVAAVCLITGVALSHRVEPGIRVEKVTLAQDTPALRFMPTGAGPHPVALLAHGYAASKETLFRYGEALAAAGFICYSVDQPGHGASPRTCTLMEAAHVLEAAKDAGADKIAVVVGPGQDKVAAEAKRIAPGARMFVQKERRGTAHDEP